MGQHESRDIYSHSSKSKRPIIIAVCSVLVVGVVVLAALLASGIVTFPGGSSTQEVTQQESEQELKEVYASGTTIGGVSVAGMTEEEAKKAVEKQIAEQIPQATVTVTYEKETMTITSEEAGVQADVSGAFEDAKSALIKQTSQSKDAASDESSKKTASSTQKVDYPVELSFDEEAIQEKIDAFADEVDCDPKDATIKAFDSSTGTFTYTEGKKGLKVDRDKLLEQVLAALKENKETKLEAPVKEIPFEKSESDVAGHIQKLGTFSTYSTNTAAGNHNMSLALASINGSVVQPGDTFSFNTATGDTTNGSLGYQQAGAIVGGKSTLQYGGGICQASTTLYGAVARSGLEIVTRYNHTWPSTYVDIGQDATVDYPALDFVFRNNTEYPIYISAGMSGTQLTVTLYGYKPDTWDKISVYSQQTGTIAQPATEYVEDSSLAAGTFELYRQGNAGRTATASRVYYKDGQVVKTESLPSSTYRALSTIYHYGPGTNVADVKKAVASGKTSGSVGTSSSSKPSGNSGSSETSKPTESSKPSDNSESSETSKPTESSKPSGNSESSETSKPTESSKPSGNSGSSESSKPTESSKPSESSKPETETTPSPETSESSPDPENELGTTENSGD